MPAGKAQLVALALAGTAQVSAAHGHAEYTRAERHGARYQVARRRRQAAARTLVRRARVHGCGGGSSKECRMDAQRNTMDQAKSHCLNAQPLPRISPFMGALALNFMHAVECPVD
jgi:hypothetical protein